MVSYCGRCNKQLNLFNYLYFTGSCAEKGCKEHFCKLCGKKYNFCKKHKSLETEGENMKGIYYEGYDDEKLYAKVAELSEKHKSLDTEGETMSDDEEYYTDKELYSIMAELSDIEIKRIRLMYDLSDIFKEFDLAEAISYIQDAREKEENIKKEVVKNE